MENGVVSSIVGWVKKPFNEEGDLMDWFLFFGLAVIAMYLWTRVLNHIRGEI